MDLADFQAALDALRQDYQRNLPNRIDELEELWHALFNAQAWDADAFKVWLRHVHSLAGSGATYGFPHVSRITRAMELAARRWLEQAPPDERQRADIENLLQELRTVANEPPSTRDRETPLPSSSDQILPEVAAETIWLYEPDELTGYALTTELAAFGYRVHETDLESIASAKPPFPRAIWIDWDYAKQNFLPDTFERLRELHRREPLLPIFVYAASDHLATRLEAVHFGATAYFVKPLVMTNLVAALEAQSAQRRDDPYRILIVEADPALATYYAEILQNAGMITQVVTNVLEVMAPLVDFHPDLILTNMSMPDVSGLELAAVLRQQEAYVSLPIVFLSGETDADKRIEAMLLGGDDFLVKPIEPNHLITSVTSRARRARILRGLAEHDSLTELLNHTRIQEQLAIEIARAQRTGTPLAYVMLDLDRFKNVNDLYGHPTGDRVLKSFARLMQQRLRKSDILGRYGGDEFAAILPETDGSRAWNVMEEIRTAFSQMKLQSDGAEFHLTCSGGIATLPPAQDAVSLNELADRALYQAKREGRNQIVYLVE